MKIVMFKILQNTKIPELEKELNELHNTYGVITFNINTNTINNTIVITCVVEVYNDIKKDITQQSLKSI